MTQQDLFTTLWRRLTAVYDAPEARAIVLWLLEERLGLNRADVYGGALERLSAEQQDALERLMTRLEQAEPVQYVLGTTSFCGLQLAVRPGVLIPRPETEELCRLVLSQTDGTAPLRVLDVGTGSGCIACTLAARLPQAQVTAWDVSPEAMAVARENARRNQVRVEFRQQDALQPPAGTEQWDVIASNPPYVCHSERRAMARNVLEHEPALALFVPDDNPLLFYRAIGQYAIRTLSPKGRLYFELNERLAGQTKELLLSLGFAHIIIYKDQFDKERFIRACK